MANIRKRHNTYQAQIRKRGFPTITKTFTTRKEAEAWVTNTESAMLRGDFSDSRKASEIPLSQVIEHYRLHLLPTKRSQS
ncbi:MAG: hypothetical protein ABW074_06440, partial [Sedimenticola sp.]